MSKNTNLSFLTDYITADITNGRIGINTPSPTVAFDVVGASKFTGASTFSSTVGIGTTSPNASWGATIANSTLYSSNALRLERNGIPTQGLNISAGGEVVTFNGFNTASDGLNSAFVWTSTAFNTTTERMRINAAGNVLINGTTPQNTATNRGNLTIDGTSSIINLSVSSTNGGYIAHLGTDMLVANVKNGYMSFETNNTERMRIASTGNVGIGTSSPNISGQGANQRVLTVQGQSGFWGGIEIGSTATAGGSLMGFLGFAGTNINTGLTAYIGSWLENTGADAGADLRFHTKPASATAAERMRIGSAGLVSIYSLVSTYTTAQGANMYVNPADGAISRSTSSIKYKTDVLNYDKGLETVNQLRPVYYKGINDGDKIFAGLIAEEVHKLGLTEFVQYAENGTPDALSYQNMVALAFKAIQELSTEINLLKQK